MMMLKDTRRSLLSMSSSALLCLAVSACGGSGDSTETETETETVAPTSAAEPSLTIASVKTFSFSWTDVDDATYYQLYENADGGSGFTQVGDDIDAGEQNYEHIVPLYARTNANYLLAACNDGGCVDSNTVTVGDNINDAIGYVKASNTGTDDYFGSAVSLSDDGTVLAIGAEREASNATEINGDETNDDAVATGAVYVFRLDGTTWNQEAYLKTTRSNYFGSALNLSGDGNTLAVGALYEDSNATGINGDQDNTLSGNSGAAYVFAFDGSDWTQQAYIKASNAGVSDRFGESVALSNDGNILAVGARYENSDATGINGDQTNNDADNSGAVYLFSRDGTTWTQDAYLKASNADEDDQFGYAISLSGDGSTLAAGAFGEQSIATGIGGDQTDNSADNVGAVYVFVHDGSSWSQQEYIKASNAEEVDYFGAAVMLSDDGDTLVVGSPYEDSNATGIDGDQTNNDNDNLDSGAVYAFSRSGSTWSQEAYIKASNTEGSDWFGQYLSLSDDGNTLAVGSYTEDSSATGLNGDEMADTEGNSGAVYLFTRSSGIWSQQSYIKATNTEENDYFGRALSLSNDGTTLAVGAYFEDGSSMGIGGDDSIKDASRAGAVYLY